MTIVAFLPAVAAQLQLLGQPYDGAALEQFLADCWPLIEQDPAASRWARAFLEDGQDAIAGPQAMSAAAGGPDAG